VAAHDPIETTCIFTAMSFNAFNRNGRARIIRAHGDDWRWRRPS
jgi:hypothetical protein